MWVKLNLEIVFGVVYVIVGLLQMLPRVIWERQEIGKELLVVDV